MMRRGFLYNIIRFAGLFTGCLFLINSIKAAPIDSVVAKIVATNFYTQTYSIKNPIAKLVYTEQSAGGEPEYYIYAMWPNVAKSGPHEQGFVIVSGDDAAHPIIGYSPEGYYNLVHTPSNFVFWMQHYKKQIASIRQLKLKASADIKNEWTAYKNNLPLTNVKKAAGAVLPLITTVWDQSPYYNSYCPDQCVAGCVATAMGQIMKYWTYPPHGIGTSEYTDNPYGTLSAIYDTTHYNWAAMPARVTRNNPSVATLMYDCGVSVNMEYTAYNSGSFMINADDPTSAESAFVKYFGYNGSTIQGLYMDNYSGSEWIALLENELNNKRPLQYAGSGDSGAHSWVCDGYNASNYFHMNWGWSGYYDGYYSLSALNPDVYAFNSGEEALIGIQPAPAIADFSANPIVVRAGDTVHFTDNSFAPTPLTAWQWTFPGAINTSSSIQNPTAVYGSPGSYTVSETVTSSEGSGTTTQQDYIIVLANNTVNVYPTLSNGTFNIQLHDASLEGSNIEFSVYNAIGQKIYTTTLVHYITTVSITVPGGIYFFRAFDSSGKPVDAGKLFIQ